MKLPHLSGKEVVQVLEKQGFVHTRTRGDHACLHKKADGKTLLVVVPSWKEIKTGALLSVIKQAGYTRDGFLALLDRKE